MDGRVRIISDGVRTRMPCDSIPVAPPVATLRPTGDSSTTTAGPSSLANCMDLMVVVVAAEDEAKQQLDGAMESATVTTAIGVARCPPSSTTAADRWAVGGGCSPDPFDEFEGEGNSTADGPGEAAEEDEEKFRCSVGVAAPPVDC